MATKPQIDYALLDRAGAGFIFFPRADRRPPPEGATDYMVEMKDGVSLAARFYVANTAYPSLLYFHGNGEIVSDHDDIAPLYRASGLNLFVTEFRGYGRSTGQSSVEHLVSDAGPLDDFFHTTLNEHGFSASRFIMGRSLGTQPTLELAAHHAERFSGLIVESGAATIRRLFDRLGLVGNDEAEALADQHEAKIRSIRLPVLQLHGEHDDLVSLEQAVGLYDLLEGTDRDLVVIPGAGHNDILWLGRTQYFETIREFVATRSSP